MNKKLILTVVAFTLIVGLLGYWYTQNNTRESFNESNFLALNTKMVALNVENKTVILQDEDTYSVTNAAPSVLSPLVVAGLGLTLVASVPIALRILNYHSKKQLEQTKK